MKKAIIVSYSEKGIEIITNILNSIQCDDITIAKTCDQARVLALNNEYDLCIINSPVHNDNGITLALYFVAKGDTQVLFCVKNEVYDQVSSQIEEYGVVTIAKPLNKDLLYSSLKLMKAVSYKLEKIRTINDKLSKQIEDIKIVDRAKFVLISHLNMSETEAHKYIEREAMNTRTTKRLVAEKILKTYDY